MKENKCQKCGAELKTGVGRYLMTITFIADVEFEVPDEGGEEAKMGNILDEIEGATEDELMNQVCHKMTFLLCRPCKEDLESNPFGLSSEPDENPIQ